MDAVTPTRRPQTRIPISFAPTDMEWQKTRFPGCEAKTLLFDRKTGLMTALMRFAPGAVLPDHEHVNIEQTYVLEGSLVDKEGPAQGIECKAGEFIWREQGSRHVAWCPAGRADARDLPGAEQVLRGRRPRHRRRGRGLGRDLGAYAVALSLHLPHAGRGDPCLGTIRRNDDCAAGTGGLVPPGGQPREKNRCERRFPARHPSGASEIYQRFQGLNLGIPHFSGVEQAMTRANL